MALFWKMVVEYIPLKSKEEEEDELVGPVEKSSSS